MGHDLAVLGDLVADLVVPIERLPLLPDNHGWAEGIFVEPGGAGNVLVAARRLQLATVALGHVGPDRYGADLLAMLDGEGIDTSETAVCSDRTTVLCIVLSDTFGQHVYLGIKDAIGTWPFLERWHAVIRNARAFYSDGYTLRDILVPDAVFAAFATARAAGVPTFFDPGPSIEFISRPVMERAIALADVLLLTMPEASMLCGNLGDEEMAAALLDLGATTVVLKLGAAGCLVAAAKEMVRVPGFPVEVVDTVGAGDSFAPAFIAGWIRGGNLGNCATLANAMGALTVTQRGAGTRIPARERLQAMLAGHPDALRLSGDGVTG